MNRQIMESDHLKSLKDVETKVTNECAVVVEERQEEVQVIRPGG